MGWKDRQPNYETKVRPESRRRMREYRKANPEFVQREREKNRERARMYRRMSVKMVGERCVRCGFDEFKSALSIHHIEEYHKNKAKKRDLDNLILLCANCHRAANSGEIPKEEITTLKRKRGKEIPFLYDGRDYKKPMKKRPMWLRLRRILDKIPEDLSLEYCGGKDEYDFEQRGNDFYLRVTFKSSRELTEPEWDTFKEYMKQEFEAKSRETPTHGKHNIIMMSPFPEKNREFIIKFQFF